MSPEEKQQDLLHCRFEYNIQLVLGHTKFVCYVPIRDIYRPHKMQIHPAWDDRNLNTTWQSSEKGGNKFCFKANM